MENSIVCSNPWCKVRYIEDPSNDSKQCPKCQSFDGELSGGVTWKDKKYDGPRMDGMPHEIDIRVNRSIDINKKW